MRLFSQAVLIGTSRMSDILADPPDPSCSRLHSQGGIQEFQPPCPDPSSPRARTRARLTVAAARLCEGCRLPQSRTNDVDDADIAGLRRPWRGAIAGDRTRAPFHLDLARQQASVARGFSRQGRGGDLHLYRLPGHLPVADAEDGRRSGRAGGGVRRQDCLYFDHPRPRARHAGGAEGLCPILGRQARGVELSDRLARGGR